MPDEPTARIKFKRGFGGYTVGDRTSRPLSRAEEMEEDGICTILSTSEKSSSSKSDPEVREKLKKGANNAPADDGDDESGEDEDDEDDLADRLPDHHMTLRSIVEDVADELGEDPPEDADAETSRQYLLTHPDETEAQL